MKKPKVEVMWKDATSFDDIYDIESSNFKVETVVSVGWLLSDTKEQLVIMRDLYGEEGDYRASGVLCIPKGWVDSVRVIEE
jgi:hypothetical protein